MTRDAMATSMDMKTPQSSYRRRTMATSEMKEFISTKGVEPVDFGINNVSEAPTPSTPNPTRRMSLGEQPRIDVYDWEEPRLDIKGFVVDYFTHRIKKDGLEWFEAPALPDGVQEEHEMMRSLGTIFETKNAEQFENFSEQLLAVPKITFQIYQDVVQTVGNSNQPCAMPYGRMVGLISFGGMVAAKMMESSELRGQVQNILVYTSLFIKSRIRQSWKEHDKNWADFMTMGMQMKEKYEHIEKPMDTTGRLRTFANWSLGAVSISVLGFAVIIGGRIVFNFK